jgi:hypothetical protein
MLKYMLDTNIQPHQRRGLNLRVLLDLTHREHRDLIRTIEQKRGARLVPMHERLMRDILRPAKHRQD